MSKKALKILVALLCIVLCFAIVACNTGNNNGSNTGNNNGGNTSGGNTSGGNTNGGNTSGGNTDGGNTDGGNTDGGNTDGGNNEEDPNGGNNSGSDNDVVIDWENLDLDGLALVYNNKARFQVVYTSNGGPAGIRLANEFVSKLRALGVDVADAISDRNADDVKDCEIIIGTGARHRGEEVNVSDKRLGPDGYTMKVVGTRVVIAGGNDNMTETAYNYYILYEMGIKNSTKEFKNGQLAVSDTFFHEEITKYKITSVTVGRGGTSLSEYVVLQDLSALPDNIELPHVESFQDDLFARTGIWLEYGNYSEPDSYEHKLIIRYVVDKAEMNSKGFHAYVKGDDIVIECAYWNAFDRAFEQFTKETILDKTGEVVISNMLSKTNNVAEVKYSQFGAISNDGKDDFQAIFNTHEYANQCGQTVVGDLNATYNVGPKLPNYPTILRAYGYTSVEEQPFSIIVQTNVDFNGATFIINDEGSDAYATRSNSLFLIASNYDPVVINGQNKVRTTFESYTQGDDTKLEIYSERNYPGKGTTSLPWLIDYVNVSAAPSVVYVENVYHKDFLRWGSNQNNGDNRRELYLVHPDGTIDSSTLPEFDFLTTRVDSKTGDPIGQLTESDTNMAITRVEIYRTDDTPVTIRNGTFINICCKTVAETEYINKYHSYARGFRFMRSHVTFEDIVHKMQDEPEFMTFEDPKIDDYRWNVHIPVQERNENNAYKKSDIFDKGGRMYESYPYYAFIYTEKTYDLLCKDVVLTGHTTYYEDKKAQESTGGQIPAPVAMGTYDMVIERAISPRFINVTQNNDRKANGKDVVHAGIGDNRFWGIMSSNWSRNMYFEGCEINRFDAHRSMWGATIKDTVIGHTINLVGGGDLYLEDVTKVAGGNGFIQIRGDYGGTYSGNITVVNCTHEARGWYDSRKGQKFNDSSRNSTVYVISVGDWQDKNGYFDWWFGYDSYMPPVVTVDGFTAGDGSGSTTAYVFNDRLDRAFYQEDPNDPKTASYCKHPLIKTEKVILGPTTNIQICSNPSGETNNELAKIPVYRRDKNGNETKIN